MTFKIQGIYMPKIEPFTTLGTNMKKYLKENAYKVTLNKPVEITYKDRGKDIHLTFKSKKDEIKINKVIKIIGMKDEIKVYRISKIDFIKQFQKEITIQKKVIDDDKHKNIQMN